MTKPGARSWPIPNGRGSAQRQDIWMPRLSPTSATYSSVPRNTRRFSERFEWNLETRIYKVIACLVLAASLAGCSNKGEAPAATGGGGGGGGSSAGATTEVSFKTKDGWTI